MHPAPNSAAKGKGKGKGKGAAAPPEPEPLELPTSLDVAQPQLKKLLPPGAYVWPDAF